MKGFLKRRWHGIPVGIITPVLLMCLLAGSAFATYTFTKVEVNVTVEEAIVLGYNWTVDDLPPYMVGGTVIPNIILEAGPYPYDMTVTITKDGDASEFCAGETLVIPLNVRNRSDGAITVNVSRSDPNPLEVQFSWDGSTWADSATIAMAGHQGTLGSDMNPRDNVQDVGSTCLYIEVHAPADCPTGTQAFGIDFSRN